MAQSYMGRILPSAAKKIQYRAIKWRRGSDDTTAVGKWRDTRDEAELDATRDYAPHRAATYEIETSDGKRTELGKGWFRRAQRYHFNTMRG